MVFLKDETYLNFYENGYTNLLILVNDLKQTKINSIGRFDIEGTIDFYTAFARDDFSYHGYYNYFKIISIMFRDCFIYSFNDVILVSKKKLNFDNLKNIVNVLLKNIMDPELAKSFCSSPDICKFNATEKEESYFEKIWSGWDNFIKELPSLNLEKIHLIDTKINVVEGNIKNSEEQLLGLKAERAEIYNKLSKEEKLIYEVEDK